MDIVCGKTAIAQGLQEKAHRLKQVHFRVHNSVSQVVLVQQSCDFWQKFELVSRWLIALSAFVVGLGGLRHATSHLFDFLVGHLFKVDSILLATAVRAALDDAVDLSVQCFLPAYRNRQYTREVDLCA